MHGAGRAVKFWTARACFRRKVLRLKRPRAPGGRGVRQRSWRRESKLSPPSLRVILGEEYPDINALEYRFLSLLAGRNEQENM
jgi:hypothetical protein